jgi:competence protein ComEA
LPPTLQGRVRLGSTQAALVAVLAAVGLVAAAVVVLRSGSGDAAVLPASGTSRHSEAHPLVPVASTTGAAVGPSLPVGSKPASGSAVAGRSGAGAQFVVVDVAGKVRRPGVVRLPTGSRVVDALRRAGGARRGVELTGLNLARVLVDGEQILVGVRQAAGVAAAAAPSAAATSAGQLVNINTATLDGLEALPGVGPVTAQKILDWRTAHGAFSSVDELLEVDGIGEKTLADLAPYVTL